MVNLTLLRTESSGLSVQRLWHCGRRCCCTVGFGDRSSGIGIVKLLDKRRHFSNQSESESHGNAPFNSYVKLQQRTRAAASCREYYNRYINAQKQQEASLSENCATAKKPTLPYDYFHTEVARRLIDRLDDINVRDEGFPLALEVGARGEFVRDAIVDGCNDDDLMLEDEDENAMFAGGRGGVRKLVQMDSCSAMLHRDDVLGEIKRGDENAEDNNNSTVCETYKLAFNIDDATPLPFPDGTFDLAISSMALHWVNDLPRLLREVERVLKPDGCFLFALPGGNTLPELRSTLVLAELERTGGVSTHVGPYVDLSNVGSLLTGTGFRLPTIDIDDLHIGYPNAMVLMEHLARMGEGNACMNRKDRVGAGTFASAACLYKELYPAEGDDGIVASAQVIYGIAWKEHESQQKPDDRGSAAHKLTEISVTRTPADGGDG